MMTTPSKDAAVLLRHPRPVLLVLAVLVALGVLLSPGSATAAPAQEAPPGKAWVRIGHFVPGMGATRIDLTPLSGDGRERTLASRATYGQVSAYESLTPGSYTATVRDAGDPPDADPVLSRSFEITANDARTIAVLGTATAPRLALLADDLTPPAAGTARVRVLSAAESADPVTVSAVDGPTIAQDAVLGQATDYATVPAGSWTLQLGASSVSTSLRDVPIASGSVYTIVVLDEGSDSVGLDVVTDAAGARTAPKGGARTGLGGTAASDVPPSWYAGPLGALALALATALTTVAAVVVRRAPLRRGVPVRT